MDNQREQERSEAKHLLTAAQSNPDAIDIEMIDKLLEADRAIGRTAALQAVSVLATEDPDQVVQFTERVIDRLEDDVLAVRSTGALALTALARECPDAVVAGVSSLIELLDEDPPLLRFRAAGALAPLTDSHAEVFVDHVDRLVELLGNGPTFDVDPQAIATSEELTTEQKQQQLTLLEGRGSELQRSRARSTGTREVVANILVEVARLEPETCTSYLTEFVAALDDDEPSVRGATIEIIRHLADHDPTAINEAIEPLIDLLEDNHEFVRGRAVRALGYAEATAAIDPLHDLADREANAEIADLAADTADWLAEELENKQAA